MTLQLHSHTVPLAAGCGNRLLFPLLSAQKESPEIALLLDESTVSILAYNPLVTLEAVRCGAQCRLACRAAAPMAAAAAAFPQSPMGMHDALRHWQLFMRQLPITAGAPLPDLFGWLGWISYDAGVMLERPLLFADSAAELPLFRWQLFRDYYRFDHRQNSVQLLHITPEGGDAQAGIGELLSRLQAAGGGASNPPAQRAPAVRLVHRTEPREFTANVERALPYIGAGDNYQANISARWRVESAEAGSDIFRRLCGINPAAYAAFFSFQFGGAGHCILSASPELFIRRNGRMLLTRPIKGTRRRQSDGEADRAAARQLMASDKDQAELAMIVDLLRNDMGRICRPGSINVRQARLLERHPTIWHTVAEIEGILDSGIGGWGDMIGAMCPAGSISGTPKIRAMEIIAELEKRPRGIYCGHMGWISPNGDGALNIAIRTAHVHGGGLTFYGGAGIVADSDPAAEYQEICAKVEAWRMVLGMAAL